MKAKKTLMIRKDKKKKDEGEIHYSSSEESSEKASISKFL